MFHLSWTNLTSTFHFCQPIGKSIPFGETYILRTKLKLFKTAVKSVFLYGCETWAMNDSKEDTPNICEQIFMENFQYLLASDNKKEILMGTCW